MGAGGGGGIPLGGGGGGGGGPGPESIYTRTSGFYIKIYVIDILIWESLIAVPRSLWELRAVELPYRRASWRIQGQPKQVSLEPLTPGV